MRRLLGIHVFIWVTMDAPRLSLGAGTLMRRRQNIPNNRLIPTLQFLTAWGSIHRQIYAKSKRSAFITFVQAATKSRTNFSLLSSWA